MTVTYMLKTVEKNISTVRRVMEDIFKRPRLKLLGMNNTKSDMKNIQDGIKIH